ncbi:transcriptional regulator with XRE-family HTH domain [Angulomicrobium tetraedrale]|uniref:Transcriptional regulator with XRE-family HTH domain n=1 Tax=Ancylobacter tetraedralis TaxID=217068 RepID=A0A839Z3P0_9HYPH|nr:helix-turn-helix transcriptional regulator [Ancylobacter tetraedralis]MBB3769583.1 transcriptional regulator with XRE-family HTH domain [Ancylobacter tetraedralis]
MRRQVVQIFRERLALVIQRSKLPPSAFARSLGIDRSTLSQVLSPTNDRLLRAETLAILSARYGISVDWLLGLTSQERPGADVVEQVRIEGQAGSPADGRFLRWYAEAENAGYPIRTVPRSFPDFLKLPEVIAYEYAGWPEIDAAATSRWAQERLDGMRRSDLSQEACLPLQGLQAFARGEGQWEQLPAALRREQLRVMSETCEALYPSLRIHLFDVRRTYSAPLTVFGPQRAILYIGGLFFVFTASPQVRLLNQRFDDLIRAAVVQPAGVSEALAGLAREVG